MEELVHVTSKLVLWSGIQGNYEEDPGNVPSGFARQIDFPAAEAEGVMTAVAPDHLNIS